MNVEGIVATLPHLYLRGLSFSCTEGFVSDNKSHENCVLGAVCEILRLVFGSRACKVPRHL